MNKVLLILLSTFTMINIASAQEANAKDEKLKAHIIDLDIAAWNNWKNKDVAAFRAGTIEEFVSISSDGISTKEQMITTAFVDCKVKSFSLHEIEMVKLNKKAVLLTYTATQDAECGGTKLSPTVLGAVSYVKRGGKWVEAFYMETGVTK
jgi:hypothetical protein